MRITPLSNSPNSSGMDAKLLGKSMFALCCVAFAYLLDVTVCDSVTPEGRGLLHVSPRVPFDGVSCCHPSHSEHSPNFRVVHSGCSMKFSHLRNDVVAQFGVIDIHPLFSPEKLKSPPHNSVLHVGSMGSRVEMIRIYASRIVAFVANASTFRDGAISKDEGSAMSGHIFWANPERWVVSLKRLLPSPALILGANINLAPKPFSRVNHFGLPISFKTFGDHFALGFFHMEPTLNNSSPFGQAYSLRGLV